MPSNKPGGTTSFSVIWEDVSVQQRGVHSPETQLYLNIKQRTQCCRWSWWNILNTHLQFSQTEKEHVLDQKKCCVYHHTCCSQHLTGAAAFESLLFSQTTLTLIQMNRCSQEQPAETPSPCTAVLSDQRCTPEHSTGWGPHLYRIRQSVISFMYFLFSPPPHHSNTPGSGLCRCTCRLLQKVAAPSW